MPVLLDAGHDAVFCNKVMTIITGLEGFDQDDVGVYVVGEHDEVFSNARSDGETTHVVSVELAYGLYPDI